MQSAVDEISGCLNSMYHPTLQGLNFEVIPINNF
jgi:hypothetical protein